MGKMTMGRSDQTTIINDTTRVIEKRVIVPVETIIEVPFEVVKEVIVEKPVEVIVERIVEKPVEVFIEKIVTIEKPVDVIVEKVVEVEKLVEVPIYIDRIVTKEIINVEEILRLKSELSRQQNKTKIALIGIVCMVVVSIIVGVI